MFLSPINGLKRWIARDGYEIFVRPGLPETSPRQRCRPGLWFPFPSMRGNRNRSPRVCLQTMSDNLEKMHSALATQDL